MGIDVSSFVFWVRSGATKKEGTVAMMGWGMIEWDAAAQVKEGGFRKAIYKDYLLGFCPPAHNSRDITPLSIICGGCLIRKYATRSCGTSRTSRCACSMDNPLAICTSLSYPGQLKSQSRSSRGLAARLTSQSGHTSVFGTPLNNITGVMLCYIMSSSQMPVMWGPSRNQLTGDLLRALHVY